MHIARRMKKLREGTLVGTFEGHEDGINCLAIAADESVLVSGSEDGTARIWDLEAAEEAEAVEADAVAEKSETEPDVNQDQGHDHVSKCLGILKYVGQVGSSLSRYVYMYVRMQCT